MVYKLKKLCSRATSPKQNMQKTHTLPIIGYGIGFDVHKDSVVVCISSQLQNNEIIQLKTHSFKHDPVGIKEMCQFLSKYDQNPTFLMECTGIYHLSVYHALNSAFPKHKDKIIAMNPLLIHNRISDLGNKNDKADAQSLSVLAFYSQILRPSYVGSIEFFSLRDLIRSYHRNQSQVNKFKNRIHRHLNSVNQKFPFDLSTEWGLKLLDWYCSKSWTLLECYNSLLQEQLKGNKAKVLQRLESEANRNGEIILSSRTQFMIQFDLVRLLSSQEANSILLVRADQSIIKDKHMKNLYENLLRIPGFGAITVLTILTEIGDYTRFQDSNAFVKFCGVVPKIEQSGALNKRMRVNRFTNKFLRYVLTQAAGRLINQKQKDSDLGNYAFKQRYLKQMPFKKASMKVANKMARKVYQIINGFEDMSMTYEIEKKRRAKIHNKIKSKGTALDPVYTRALRRDIQNFLVSHSQMLNSTSRYHLVSGFKRLLQKSQYIANKKEFDDEKGEKKEVCKK